MDGERLREEIAWQEQQLASIERDWRRLPYISILVLLTIPAGYYWGKAGVFVALAGMVMILLVSAYVIHGHRTDYQGKIASLRRELAKHK